MRNRQERVRIRASVLRKELARRSMRQADLARAIGATEAQVSRMLSEQREPRPAFRRKILDFFGRGFDDLFEIVSDKEPARR